MEKGPVMNTGPDKVGAGLETPVTGGSLEERGREGRVGRAAAVLISFRARTQMRGAHLRTAHPKVRTQKKCLTLEERCASAPRIHIRPGWNRGPGGHREGRGASARNGGGARRSVAHMFHQPIAFMPQNREKCLA
jgi:hypothetical protein